MSQAQTLAPLYEIGKSQGDEGQVAFAPQGNLLAWTSLAFPGVRQTEIRSITSKSLVITLGEEPTRTRFVTFEPDGDKIAWGLGSTIGILFDLHKSPVQALKPLAISASTVAFSPDGSLLAVALDSVDKENILVRLFDANTGQVKTDLKALPKKQGMRNENTPISTLAFSSDGQRLVASDLASTRVWNVATGKLIHEESIFDAEQVVLSRDGTWKAVVHSETPNPNDKDAASFNVLELGKVGTDKVSYLTTPPGLSADFESCGRPTFSFDGRFVAAPVWRSTGTQGQNSITVWRTSDGKEVLRCPVQFEQKSVVFGPSDERGGVLASIYTNSIDKLQHAILWRFALPK